MIANYETFLSRKQQLRNNGGFDPVWMPDFLFPFQRHLVEWALRKGRAAVFAECGADIAANIEAHGRVTDSQFSALENMLDGLKRWFHD